MGLVKGLCQLLYKRLAPHSSLLPASWGKSVAVSVLTDIVVFIASPGVFVPCATKSSSGDSTTAI